MLTCHFILGRIRGVCEADQESSRHATTTLITGNKLLCNSTRSKRVWENKKTFIEEKIIMSSVQSFARKVLSVRRG